MNVFPDFGGLTGIDGLKTVVGALLTVTLVAAVAALIVSGIVWAFGASTGNYRLASRGRTGVLVALGVAILAGSGVALLNWLIGVGQQL
jgi:steroid 5-alpha reductase family enzyme